MNQATKHLHGDSESEEVDGTDPQHSESEDDLEDVEQDDGESVYLLGQQRRGLKS